MGENRRLLYDPRSERSACGIGLVADLHGRASRELLDRALAGLAAVGHRGAWAADGVTGDGAGVLLPLSPVVTGMSGAGVAMCFLREGWLRSAVEDACRAEGLQPAGWREVPTRTAALGVTAVASLPRINQLVLAPKVGRGKLGIFVRIRLAQIDRLVDAFEEACVFLRIGLEVVLAGGDDVDDDALMIL